MVLIHVNVWLLLIQNTISMKTLVYKEEEGCVGAGKIN